MKRTMVPATAVGMIVLLGGCGNGEPTQGSDTQAVEQAATPQPKSREESCAMIAEAERAMHARAFQEDPEMLELTDSELTPEQRDFAEEISRDYAATLVDIERQAPEEVAVELRNIAPAIVPIMSSEEGNSPGISAGMIQEALDSMYRINSMCGGVEMFDGNPET